jgi:uncharacterized membrane protein YeaQ/YmgE (transglycosylase-associated protein family)
MISQGGDMFANILIWTILGVAAGFLVFLLFPYQRKYFLGTLMAGVVGALVGGIVYSAFEIGSIASSIDTAATIGSVIGAALLIYFIRLLVKSEEEPKAKTN